MFSENYYFNRDQNFRCHAGGIQTRISPQLSQLGAFLWATGAQAEIAIIWYVFLSVLRQYFFGLTQKFKTGPHGSYLNVPKIV